MVTGPKIARVLWVGEPRVALPSPTPEYEIVVAADVRHAMHAISPEAVPVVVVVDHPDPKTAVLQMCELAERAPGAARLACASYESLPEIIRAGGSHVIEAIVSAVADPSMIHAVLRRHIARAERLSPLPTQPEEAAARTIAALASLSGTVVRPLPAGASTIEVVVSSNELGDAHAMLPSYWGWPLKARGEPHDARVALPAGVRTFGPLSRAQEAYAMQDSLGRTWFLMLFPWFDEPRTTLILGVANDDDSPAREDLEALHSLCLSGCAEFPVPAPPRASGSSWYASEYGWIVTPAYVGPDRRVRDTSLFNRFMFFGRRKRVATVSHVNGPSQAELFVDRLTPQVARIAAIYFVLSLFDTAMTLAFVGRGDVRELNPILAPLLSSSAALFLFAKNAISLASLVVVVRLQLQRGGRVVLWINALLYAALDLYWLCVIVRLWLRSWSLAE